jgi:hypothetical protein
MIKNKSKIKKHINHCEHMIFCINENKFFKLKTYYFKKQIEISKAKL